MKQKILLKTMLLLCALVAGGVSSAWADSWTRVTSIQTLLDGGTFIMGYEATAKSGVIVPLRSKDCNATTSANGYFNTGTTDGSSTSGTIDMSDLSGVTTSDYEIYVAESSTTGYINIQRTNNTGNYYGATSGGTTSNKARLYTSGNSNETNLLPEWASEANNQFKLTANVSGSYKNLKYNTTSPRFAYYNSAGEKIVFYKKVADAKTITGLSYTGTPTKTSYYVGESFDPTGLTVTATYDDSSSDNVTASVVWTPNPLTIGTTSVTGTYMGETVTVNGLTVTAAPGSAENPYTCAEAIAAQVAAGANVNDKYVKGIVTKISGSNYWISDDGVVGNEQFECYKGKQDDGTTDINNTYLNVGDVVVAHGNITKYSSTYELASGNQVYSKTRPVVTVTSNNDSYGTATLSTRTVTAEPASGYRFASPKYTVTTGSATVVDNGDNTFSLSNIWADCAIQFNFEAIPVLNNNSILYVADAYNLDIGDAGGEINLAGATAIHGTLQSEIVTASTTVNASKYTWENNILTVLEGGNGTIVIRFWVDEDEEYYGVEQIATVTVKADPVIAYEDATEETPYGTPYTIDTDLIEGGDITLSSSNTAVATVSDLTITPVAVGTTTITINTTAATFWNAGSATFTLNVTEPVGQTTVAASGSFVKVTSTDDITDGKYLIVYEDGNLAFDGGRDPLDATNNYIDVTITSDEIVADATTNAAAFTIDASAGTILSESGYYIGQTSDANGLATSDVTAYTNTLSINTNDGGFADIVSSGGAYLRYNSASNQNRFRYFKSSTYTGQNAIQLYKFVAGPAPTTTVELNTSGYATYCSVNPMDFSSTTGYTAWRVSNIAADGTITFTKITEAIKGGQGVLLYNKDADGVNKSNVTVSFADGTTEFDNGTDSNDENDNLLVGTTAPKYLAQVVGDYTNFGLNGGEFKKAADGVTIPANKAYLPVLTSTVNYLISNGVKAFTFVFDDEATGIRTIEKVSVEEAAEIFDLSGRRLNKIQKGINIVNGKKILY